MRWVFKKNEEEEGEIKRDIEDKEKKIGRRPLI